MAVGGVLIAVAKWAAGIGATVIATDLLNDYYQKNKGKIGKTFEKWVTELGEIWQENYERDIGSARVELLDQTTNETATQKGTEKEQTNGLQGSMNFTEFNEWLKSEEGRRFLNETAINLRTTPAEEMNPSKQEQIESIQGNYDTSEQYKWETSAAGQAWLEQAEKIRQQNEAKEQAKPGEFEFTEDETIGEMLPNPGEEKYDEEKTPIDTPTQDIVDKTDENLGTNNIGAINWLEWAEQEQQKRWARDDAIMKATWEREDNAWQRSVADMRKAGINPNLINAQPAASGGGITQSSGQNIAGATSQMNIDLEEMQQLLDQAFKGDENDKDRFADLLGKVLNFVTIIAMMKK